MLKIVYDRKDLTGFVPNLAPEPTIGDRLAGRHMPANQPPYSTDFRFRQYLAHEGIDYQEVDTESYYDEDGIYPVHLEYFDPDIDYLALMSDRAREQVQRGRLTVVFYYPNGQDPVYDIVPRLDYLADVHQIDRSMIRVISGNATCERYDDFVYVPDAELRCRYLNQDSEYVVRVNLGPREKKLAYCNPQDRPWSRLYAASLWYHGLHSESYFVHGKAIRGEYFDQDPVWRWHTCWEKPKRLSEMFAMHLPMGLAHDDGRDSITRTYDNAYWRLVAESYFAKEDLSLSDATFKTILNMQPFIIVGPPGCLRLLKKSGYKTFGNYIDEGYDSVQNDEKRLYKCFQLAFYLYNLPHEEHQQLMRLVEPVLIHNQEVLLSSKKHMLLETLDKIR